MERDSREGFTWRDGAALLALLAAVAVIFLTSPTGGDFYWSDPPRHALNGLFILDFIKAAPWPPTEWKEFAVRYYFQYPALTIGFYPPLFYLISAPFFGLFGATHAAAQLPVALFHLLAGWGAYAVARRFLLPLTALGVALIVMGNPATGYWGRQVFLDIPSYAALIWSVFFLLRYGARPGKSQWYAAVLFFLVALHFKQTAIFMLPVFLAFAWSLYRQGELPFKTLAIGGGIFIIGVIPLLVLTLQFGMVNVGAAAGGQSALESPRFFLENWLFYLNLLPRWVGWPAALPGMAYLGAALFYPSMRPSGRGFWLMAGWFLFGYLFFSWVALKSSRYMIVFLFPLALFAGLFFQRLLPARWAGIAALVVGVWTFHQGVTALEVPRVSGYAKAAGYVAEHAPQGGTILFYGYRDGSFIFNLRAREERQDLSVLRADKILLDVAVKRDMGVRERGLNPEEIIALLHRYGVRMLVVQPGFWDDIPQMQAFLTALRTGPFEKKAAISVGAPPHPKSGCWRSISTVALPPRLWNPWNSPWDPQASRSAGGPKNANPIHGGLCGEVAQRGLVTLFDGDARVTSRPIDQPLFHNLAQQHDDGQVLIGQVEVGRPQEGSSCDVAHQTGLNLTRQIARPDQAGDLAGVFDDPPALEKTGAEKN